MPGRLSTNMLVNAASALMPLGAAAIATPLIIDDLGTAAFGIWTLLAGFVVYLAIAESAFGPAVQRFVAVAHGAGDRSAAARLLWTVVGAYALVGAVLSALVFVLAADIVDAFDFPAALEPQARQLLETVAFALPLSLFSAGLGNVLFGLERFVATASSSALGAIALLTGVIVVLQSDAGLESLGYPLLAYQAVPVLLRSWALRDLVFGFAPAIAHRRELRELASFSARLQISALSVLINGQSDRVVAGLVAPASTVGQLGVGAQVAEAGRLVASALMQPMISRFSALHGAGDAARVIAEYRRISRVWITITVGATAVGIGLLSPLLKGWLGDGFGQALRFGAILMLAYGINVATGVSAAFGRAVGAIGIEARAGLYMVGLNIALTVPLGIVLGVDGVVLGTLGANVFGTAWFMRRIHALAPLEMTAPAMLAARLAVLALAAGALTYGVGSLCAELLPRFVSLLPSTAAAACALLAYASISLGTSPRAIWRARASARTEA